jgi:hypothetical protein
MTTGESTTSGFLIQIEPEVDDLRPQADTRGFTNVSEERLRQIGADIHRMATQLIGSIQPDKLSPKELEIEFGIGLKGEGGVPFFAKGSVETNFTIKAKWDWSRGK